MSAIQDEARCAGCNRLIDPMFDSPLTDSTGRAWHPTCRTAAVGPADQRDGGAGPLVAWALITLIIPLVGIAAGIIYLFRNRIGQGLGLLAEGVVMICVYAALLA